MATHDTGVIIALEYLVSEQIPVFHDHQIGIEPHFTGTFLAATPVITVSAFWPFALRLVTIDTQPGFLALFGQVGVLDRLAILSRVDHVGASIFIMAFH